MGGAGIKVIGPRDGQYSEAWVAFDIINNLIPLVMVPALVFLIPDRIISNGSVASYAFIL